MVLWSGGGVDYAQMWGDKLGLEPFIVLTKKNKMTLILLLMIVT